MSSQADFESFDKVTTHVIKPLERHYGKVFDADTIADFVDSLGKYPEATLKSAMVDVRENEPRRPTLAMIVHSVKKQSHSSGQSIETGWIDDFKQKALLRSQRIETMAADYLEIFLRENQQRLEKLSPHKRRQAVECVYESALFQAKLIEREPHAGYSAIKALNYPYGDWKGRKKWWLEMCRRNADKGMINVETPWVWFEPREEQAA